MGADRVRAAFEARKAQGQAALVIYLTFGDPSEKTSLDIVRAVAEAGADVVELGVPFSDPSADGEVIQEAMDRALAGGATLSSTLAGVTELRAGGCDVPVVLFGYYNPLVVRGLPAFAGEAAAAGVDAVLTVDVPMDELAEVQEPLAGQGIGVVPLVAPTSGDDRIARLGALSAPFVYYISMTGVTGASIGDADAVPARVAAIRDKSGSPVAVGFGIRTAADARRVAGFADGVVIGSEVIRQIAGGDAAGAARRAGAYVAEVRSAMDA